MIVPSYVRTGCPTPWSALFAFPAVATSLCKTTCCRGRNPSSTSPRPAIYGQRATYVVFSCPSHMNRVFAKFLQNAPRLRFWTHNVEEFSPKYAPLAQLTRLKAHTIVCEDLLAIFAQCSALERLDVATITGPSAVQSRRTLVMALPRLSTLPLVEWNVRVFADVFSILRAQRLRKLRSVRVYVGRSRSSRSSSPDHVRRRSELCARSCLAAARFRRWKGYNAHGRPGWENSDVDDAD